MLAIHNTEILTGNRTRNGHLLIDDTRIARVSYSHRPPWPSPDTVIDGTGLLLIPGLVNAHTHSDEHFLRGLYDAWPLEMWTVLAHPIPPRPPDPEWVYLNTMLGALEMVRNGITAVHDHVSLVPWPTLEGWQAVASAYRDIGLRAIVSPNIRGRWGPDSLTDVECARSGRGLDSDQILATVESIARDARSGEPTVRAGVGPSAPHRLSPPLLKDLVATARRHGLRLHTHLLETRWQADFAHRIGQPVVRWMESMGMLGRDLSVAHGVWVDPEQMASLATAGVSVVHNPVSNLKLGSGIMPWRAYARANVTLALGTDGASTNDTQDLFEVMKFAALLPRPRTPDYREWPTATEVFRAATQGGADSIGLGTDLGRIEPGALADLVLLDRDAPASQPLNHPLNQLVFANPSHQVTTVIVNGRIVLRNRQLITVNERELLAKITHAQKAYLSLLGLGIPEARRMANEVARAYRRRFLSPRGAGGT